MHGGLNRSNSPRVAMNITYSLSWLRQEENQYISCPTIAKNFDADLTDLLGYSMAHFALGLCSDPKKIGEGSDVLMPDMVALGRE